MGRKLFGVGLLAAMGIAAACSSFESENPGTTPVDDGGTDALPGDDGGPMAPDAEAGALPFCKTVDATFCDDFDESQSLSTDWKVDDLDGGARYAIRAPGASPPNSLFLAGGLLNTVNDGGACNGGKAQLSRPTAGVKVSSVDVWFKINFDDEDGGVNHGDGNIGPEITVGILGGSHCNFYLSNTNGVPILRLDSPGNGPGTALTSLSPFALTKGQWLDVRLRFDLGAGGTTVTLNDAVVGSYNACSTGTLGQVAIGANCAKQSTQASIDDFALWVR